MCICVCTGITLPSLTSSVYFGAFLGLVWWWVFSRSIGLLLFSCLCVMMAIFSGGHLLALYLYQLPLTQQLVPPDDIYARYRSHCKVGLDAYIVLIWYLNGINLILNIKIQSNDPTLTQIQITETFQGKECLHQN